MGRAGAARGSFSMNGIGKQAAFYRGYLPDDRSLGPLTVLLPTTVALWLLLYVCVGGYAPQGVASFDTQRSACPLEIDPQMKSRADLSLMLGLLGSDRVASTEDGSPIGIRR
jgi:hypothetical protein